MQNPNTVVQNPSNLNANTPGVGSNNMDYNNYGNYTRDLKELKKRDQKLEEKLNGGSLSGQILSNQVSGARSGKPTSISMASIEQSVNNLPRARGRKPIHIKR